MKLFGILMSAVVVVALLVVAFGSQSADASATPVGQAEAKAACCSAAGTPDCCAPGAECCVAGAECCETAACCEAKAACCETGEACCKASATHAVSVGQEAVRGLASAKASSCCDGGCRGGDCSCATGGCCDEGCGCCETGDCSCEACGCECCAL